MLFTKTNRKKKTETEIVRTNHRGNTYHAIISRHFFKTKESSFLPEYEKSVIDP